MSQPPEDNTTDGAADARLARLERAVVALSERLRGIEDRLGVPAQEGRAGTRPFGQGAQATPAPDESARAFDETAHTPAAPRDGGWDDSTQTTLSAGTSAEADAPPRARPGAFTGESDAAAFDESGAVEDYPFAVPPTRAPEEPEGQSPFASESSTYRPFASSAQSAESGAGGVGVGGGVGGAGAAASPPRARRDLETLIGGRWLPWIAIIALTVGVGFFLKLAFDNQWIGPGARVLLGAAAGCALLALAEFLHARGYRPYAHVLTGGGILILYLSVYAARVFYDLVGVTAAFALMGAVTTTAVLLAVRRDARSIAVLGLVGGFATPVLLSTGVDRQIGLFTYVAFLDAGVLALAYFKGWRVLNHLAYASTVVLFAGWALVHYEPWKEWRTFFFLTLFFLMFSALAVLHNVLRQRRARWPDVSLVVSNATLYYAASYAVLYGRHESLLAALALALAVFYALLYYTARARHPEDRLLALAYVGAAATFLTVAIAVRFDQHWVTIGWAVEGLMLTWLGLRTGERAPRYLALAVFTFAVEHWFVFDLREFAPLFGASFAPLLNTRAVSSAAVVGALAGANHLYRRRAEGVDKDERDIIASVLTLAANAVALTLLTADVSDYFGRRAGDAADGTGASADDSRQLALTLLWSLYAAGALAVGVARRLTVLRYGALLVLFCAAVKLVAVDAPFYDAAWHTLVFNQTFAAFAAVVAALAYAARTYARADWIAERERVPVTYLLAASANALAVAGLSLETAGYFDRSQALVRASRGARPDAFVVHDNLENTKQLALTFVWTLYACAAFTIGVRRARASVRYGALGLLAAAGLKIAILDAGFYAATWHAPLFNQTFAAFVVFVAACWYVAHLYAGAGEDVVDADERRQATASLAVVGNLFAVAALSLEASGYFRKQLAERAAAGANTRDLRLAQQLSLSLVWMVYGGATLLFGHVRQNKTLRLLALALLAATTVKVFFFDLSGLERLYRIISFIVLGLVLLAVSFLYQQRQRGAKEAGG
ncbi:MAG TPA: DUF2339 domain-containing protein [Pyrinomonadaceae bacterium]|jgi:uncharacterized membrane protein|nr:DUF2339 domain-containing protein [Pyrinomonadaceae bacterium]